MGQEVCNPFLPHDEFSLMAHFSAVQLVHGRAFGLLLAIIYFIQHRLQTLTWAFCKKRTIKKMGKELILAYDGLVLEWSSHTSTWWHSSCCTPQSFSSRGKNHQKVFASYIFNVLRTHAGRELRGGNSEAGWLPCCLQSFLVLPLYPRYQIRWRILRWRRWPLFNWGEYIQMVG